MLATPHLPQRLRSTAVLGALALALSGVLPLTALAPVASAAAGSAGSAANAGGAGGAISAAGTRAPAGYLVTMRADSAAQHAARTARAAGAPIAFDAGSTESVAHRAGLTRSHRAAAAAVGVSVQRDLTVALNAFSARLTPEQARALAARSDVLSVHKISVRRPVVVGTPDRLGLTGTSGVYATRFGAAGGPSAAGRGIVVGDLDTGVWPENASFAGAPLPVATRSTTVGAPYRLAGTTSTTVMRKADGRTFRGDCSGLLPGRTSADAWSVATCSSTLISARSFPPAVGWVAPTSTDPKGREWASPRDSSGHGSHTASTAVGRSTPMTVTLADGSTRSYPASAGVAPGASLAVYKVCWNYAADTDHDGVNDSGCPDDSIVAAIDQAVADGVDVLNYSISGASDTLDDPVQLAFKGAAAAGVFVAAASGNYGEYGEPANNPSPWVTTVANATWTGTIDVAPSSSRGPSSASDDNLLKPDLAGPGTDVIAAVPPTTWSTTAPSAFESMSGTSMSTPHVSGAAALLLSRFPRWTPMMVKSALMTTADPTTFATKDVFASGAGYLRPGPAFNPGLVLDAPASSYNGYLQGLGVATGAPALRAVDFNGPSIAVGHLAAPVTTRRTFLPLVTGTWKVTASLPGFTVTVPASVTASSIGQAVPVSVRIARSTAQLGTWSQGWLTLSGPTTVRLPLVARAELAVPRELSVRGTTGSQAFTVSSPFATTQTATVLGPVAAVTQSASGAPGTTVPGTAFTTGDLELARFTLTAATPAGTDLDLELQRRTAQGTWETYASSATSSANEQLDVGWLPAGTYRLTAVVYAAPGTASFTLSRWLLPGARTGSLSVAPNPVTIAAGGSTTVTARWSGLTAGRVYLGLIRYPSASRPTVVTFRP